MTLKEAISHALEVAEQEESIINYPHSDIVLGDLDIESRKHYVVEQRQLAKWLKELKELRSLKTDYVFFKAEAKKLLKAVVKDMNATVAEVYNGGLICECCKWKSQIGQCCCPGDGGCDTEYQWRYVDEVKKLLNDEK